MSHKVIESHAIQPHNAEANRVDTLLPEQLRSSASNFIDLLTEYYNYMNIDGIVNSLNIISAGSGDTLSYNDFNASEAKLGLKVTGFVPSTYNQTYKKLTREEVNQTALPATEVYQGLSVDNYFIAKLDNNRTDFKSTWVMLSNLNGVITVDFYDKNWNLNEAGSNTDNLRRITWFEQSTGHLQ
jgi:hypothetical protein